MEKNYTGKRPQTVCRRTSTKDPVRQPPNTSRRDKSHENCLQDICLCLLHTSYLKVLCRSHVSDSCLSIHQYGSSTRSTSCLSIFVSQAPLQDPCRRIHVSASLYLRILCKIHVSGSISQPPYVSQDPLQDPCLRIQISTSICLSGASARSMSPSHVSTSLYLRVLCKIHVSGFMSQHPHVSQDPLQDPCLRIHVPDSALASAKWILCKIHVSGLMSQHLCVSGTSTRSMSPIHVSASTNMGRLQDPCLRTHVSASTCISGSSARSMSPIPCLSILFSGSSARSMSLDSCLSIHMYLRILCKIHVSDSCLSIFISQGPLQDPRRRIHVSASSYLRNLCKIHVSDSCLSIHQNGSSTRSTSSDSCLSIFVSHGLSAGPMSPDPCRSIHLYLTIRCKIHVSGLMSPHLCISGSSARSMSPGPCPCRSIFISQDPLHDPCLRFMSQHPPIWIHYKIHVFGFMSQHLCISCILCKIHVSRSMSQHPFLRILCKIHVSGSISQPPYVSQDPLQDPCLRIHLSASLYLRIHVSASICISGSSARSMSPDPCLRFMSQHPLIRICCMIHVSLVVSRHPYLWILSKIRISAFIPVDPAQNRHGMRFLWPAQGKHSDRDPL